MRFKDSKIRMNTYAGSAWLGGSCGLWPRLSSLPFLQQLTPRRAAEHVQVGGASPQVVLGGAD